MRPFVRCVARGTQTYDRVVSNHFSGGCRPVVAELLPSTRVFSSYRKEQLIIAGWVLLVTTLPSDQWSAQDVLRMYRARWQVELVIKRMKQVLEITTIHGTTPESVEPSVRAFLVAWLLQEQEAVWVRHELEHGQAIARGEAEPSDAEWERITSSWLVTKICVETVRNQVRGQWTRQRLHACLPDLQRYFCSKKRRGGSHQETEMRHWLLERLRKSHEAYQKAA